MQLGSEANHLCGEILGLRGVCAEKRTLETVEDLLDETSTEGSRTLGSADTTEESSPTPVLKRPEPSRPSKPAEPPKPKSLVVRAPQEPGSRVKVLELALAHAKQEAEKAREETRTIKDSPNF